MSAAFRQRLGLIALFAIALAACIRAASALAAEISDLDPAKSYKTAAITFTGNRKFSDDDLLGLMQTKTRVFYEVWKPRPSFIPDTFKGDIKNIRRFYQAHGYYQARVDDHIALKGNMVTANIRIHEGEPIKVAAIRINIEGGGPPPRTIMPSFAPPLRKGQVFDESKYQLGEQRLLALYMQNGYARVHVTRRAQVFAGPRRAYIWYTVAPGVRGVFGKTVVTGTRKADPDLVMRELAYKPGEMFDARKIEASREKIVGLNLFSSVAFDPQNDPGDPAVVPIEIKVNEKPKHSLNLMLGYNTESQENVGLSWSDYNFMGGGRQFTIDGVYSSIITTADAKLIQPWFFSPKSTLVLDASLYQEVYQTYTLNAPRFDPLETWVFTPQLSASFGWRLEYLEFNSLNSRTIAALGGVRRHGILSGPAAYLVYNTTEDPMNPASGVIATLGANASDPVFGGDYRYWRALGQIKHYNRMPFKVILATRLEIGLADTFGPARDIPLSERFYSGGEGSVRGYALRRIGPLSPANQPLGGLDLIETSIELRRQLFWKLGGAVFFDCGQVAERPFRIPVDALQCGYGPAASFVSPVGPLRVDLGFPTRAPRGDNNWQVYFSIGQYF
jgi:outer membrane protein assembly complex protein YaeT